MKRIKIVEKKDISENHIQPDDVILWEYKYELRKQDQNDMVPPSEE